MMNNNFLGEVHKVEKKVYVGSIPKNCGICGKVFFVSPYRKDTARFCSGSCRGKYVGQIKLARAKPRISTQGYYFIMSPGYHRANKQGYAKVADIEAEKLIGRKLLKTEVVHHINGNKLDDSPENLCVLDRIKHDTLHSKERWLNYQHKKCSYTGCDRKHSAKGYCKMHYKKFVTRGQ